MKAKYISTTNKNATDMLNKNVELFIDRTLSFYLLEDNSIHKKSWKHLILYL